MSTAATFSLRDFLLLCAQLKDSLGTESNDKVAAPKADGFTKTQLFKRMNGSFLLKFLHKIHFTGPLQHRHTQASTWAQTTALPR